MDAMKSLGMIFTSPEGAARIVTEKPRWVLPLVVFIIAIVVSGYGSFRYKAEFQKEIAARIVEDTGIQVDLDMTIDDTPWIRLRSGLLEAAGSAVFILLVPAALFNGIASIAGGAIGFKRMFTYMCHVGLIVAAGNIIRIPLMVLKQSYDVRLGAAAFLPHLDPISPLGVFLGSLDLFSIWAVVALVMGYRVLSGMGIKKAAVIVVGLWLLAILVLVGFAYLRSQVTGRA